MPENCSKASKPQAETRLLLFPEADTGIGDKQNEDYKKSGQCPTTPDRITAASIIHGMGPQK